MSKTSNSTVSPSRARPTMRHIARLAGVSPTVVSQTLNKTPGAQVAEHTRKRVVQVAEETGYAGALLASSIKKKLRHLGIAVGSASATGLGQSFEIFEGVREAALAREYYPIVQPMPTAPGQKDCAAAVQKMAELHRTKLVDGFLVDKQAFSTASISELHARGVPVVVVGGSPHALTQDSEPIPSVNVDDFEAGRIGTNFLVESGHRRIALMTPPYACFPQGLRSYRVYRALLGYTESLSLARIAPDDTLIVDGDPADKHQTFGAVGRLLELPEPPTAIFVSDDVMAVMVLQALRRRGLRIPDDVSIVGYGDLPVATLVADPELTTVRVPLRECGRRAAGMLIDLLEVGEESVPRQELLPPQLVIRGSTRRR